MLVSLILNGIKLLIGGVADGFRRKASFAGLAASCGVLGFLGLFFVLSAVSGGDAGLAVAGGVLLALAACLILLNTVFRDKGSAEVRADSIRTEGSGAGPAQQSASGSAAPEGGQALSDDTVLESYFVDGFADGKRVGFSRHILYGHADRSVICELDGFPPEVLLTDVPKEIRTKEELIEYAKAHGVRFFHPM